MEPRVSESEAIKKMRKLNELFGENGKILADQRYVEGLSKMHFQRLNLPSLMEVEKPDQRRKKQQQLQDKKRTMSKAQRNVMDEVKQAKHRQQRIKELENEIKKVMEAHLNCGISQRNIDQLRTKKPAPTGLNESANIFRKVFQLQNRRVMKKLREKEVAIREARERSEQEHNRMLERIFNVQVKDKLVDEAQVYFSKEVIDKTRYQLDKLPYKEATLSYDLLALELSDEQGRLMRSVQPNTIMSIDYITNPITIMLLEIVKNSERDWVYLKLRSETQMQKWDSSLWIGKYLPSLMVNRCFFKYVFDEKLRKIADDFDKEKKRGVELASLDDLLAGGHLDAFIRADQELVRPIYRISSQTEEF